MKLGLRVNGRRQLELFDIASGELIENVAWRSLRTDQAGDGPELEVTAKFIIFEGIHGTSPRRVNSCPGCGVTHPVNDPAIHGFTW